MSMSDNDSSDGGGGVSITNNNKNVKRGVDGLEKKPGGQHSQQPQQQYHHQVGGTSRNKNHKEHRNKGSSVEGVAEENLLLRRHLRKQEEKIKLLATKLVRVVGERKSKEKRDEQLIEEQKGRLSELEGTVNSLRNKLNVSREQLASYTKLIPTGSTHHLLHPPYHPSGSKVGIKQSPSYSKSTASSTNKKLRPTSSSHPSWCGSSASASAGILLDGEFTSRVEGLLLEAKGENQALEDQLRHTRTALSQSQLELELLRGRLREVESSAGEELALLRSQLEVEDKRREGARRVEDNISLIRLEREARRAGGWASSLESQLRGMEEELSRQREKGVELEGEVRRLEEELREEQSKCLGLGRSLEERQMELGRLKELEEEVRGLAEENRILKESNDCLVEKRLSSVALGLSGGSSNTSCNSRIRLTRDEEDFERIKKELFSLEERLKIEVRLKAELGESVGAEKVKRERLEGRVIELERELGQLKLKLGEKELLLGKSSLTSNVASVAGAGEALVEELGQTQWQLVQVRDELDKTRQLLRTQMMISREWGREVEEMTKKLDRTETFHHQKLAEFMELLEQRTRQMVVLESTLEAIRPTPTTATQKVQEQMTSGGEGFITSTSASVSITTTTTTGDETVKH